MQSDVVAGSEAQATAWRCLLAAQAGAEGFQLLQDAFRMRFECLAIGSQDAAFANTIKQRSINRDFELAYALANRGLRDVQSLRGEREGLEFGYGKKGVNLIDLHLFQWMSIPKRNQINENNELVLF